MDSPAELLSDTGPLAGLIQGFSARPQQQALADAINDAIHEHESLICEAGTGTGKTFAYLVPALLCGRKVIISTGTRNLQDQLFHRDLPLVRAALASPAQGTLLKGRSNYLCLQRLEATAGSGRLPADHLGQLARVQEWAGRTRGGDIAELGLPDHDPIWPWVTSTTDNCLGQDCPHWSHCHLVEARRRAQESDLVVINHHLLCADLALRDEGFGEILPGADCFVLDEAHQLPEVASGFFGSTLSARQLLELGRDVEIEYHREAGDAPQVLEQVEHLRKAVRELRLSMGQDVRRGPWTELEPVIRGPLDHLGGQLERLAALLQALAGRGKGLDKCHARCLDLKTRLNALGEEGDAEEIRWFEALRQGFRLNRTPLEIADIFSAHMDGHPAAWVFTSATLAVGESFEHFARQLGIQGPDTGRWDSPFDYRRQALLFLPRGMPDPASRSYNRAVVSLAERLLQASQGRAFLLFTSHRALEEAADWLAGRIPFPLLVQGDAPRADLLERFRRSGNGVLLGTASFWEGVDVRGEALSCVIIDKLPFASPGDPVLQARIAALRRRGGNPFRDFQLPQAVITLKQGAGRLIRDVTDRGVLAICDPRLLNRSYGRTFLGSLPSMRRSSSLREVAAFFSTQEAPGGAP
jgi:ATP-dependent DNA helicase DinG